MAQIIDFKNRRLERLKENCKRSLSQALTERADQEYCSKHRLYFYANDQCPRCFEEENK